MQNERDYLSILRKYWGYGDFRGIQREVIESIGAGRDTLGLMPTGGGKSITFQVPALAMPGICIVFTPLISLMKDQVENLRSRGIKAAFINSTMAHDKALTVMENSIFGAYKFLYISPERLTSELFVNKLSRMKVCFITVDEAHCICQWGYDFRPSYLRVADIRDILPGCPVLALTATATPAVARDIQQKLRFRESNVLRMSFERKNLAYIVRREDSIPDGIARALRSVPGSCIIYTRSRRNCEVLAAQLNEQQGETATFYHAGLSSIQKNERQERWRRGEVRVMVATNAFGMGIDKPDVRVVLHADCPDSLEAYFQEAGRAGRDGQKAYCVLLYNDGDSRKLQKRIDDTFPPKDEVREVYDHLAYFYQIAVGSGYHAVFEFPLEKFCHVYHHFPTRVVSALHILSRAGYLEYDEEEDSQARVRFMLERDELYRLRDNGPHEDAVIVALLRNYSGLFNDYSYIDEAFLAMQTGLTQVEIYLTLKELARKRIIDFIPQRRMPLLCYSQRREDSEHLAFPPVIYDDLKKRYAERIAHMTAYATTTNQCRSRMLLRYFGEESRHDCGHCDICLERRGEYPDKESMEQAGEQIVRRLEDGLPHSVSELHDLPLPYRAIDSALQRLVDEEIVEDNDGMLCLRVGHSNGIFFQRTRKEVNTPDECSPA